jgi:hypothetical protein
VGSNPETGIKIFHIKFGSKRRMFFHSRQLSYKIFLPCSIRLVTQLETSFLSSFFLFNLMANITSHWYHTDSFLSFFPIQSTPRTWLWVQNPCPSNWSTQFINPLFAITSAGSTLIVLRSSVCWIRQQLGKWSVVEPTWLPSSNREASLRGYERLKDQLQESGWKEKMKKKLVHDSS